MVTSGWDVRTYDTLLRFYSTRLYRKANLNNVFYRPIPPCYPPGRQEDTCAYLS